MLLCGYQNTVWCKNTTTTSENTVIKSMFLMQNCKCTGLNELQKLNETIIYLFSIAAPLLSPFGTLRFLERSNRAVFNKNITYKKAFKKEDRKPNRNFPIVNNSPRGGRKSLFRNLLENWLGQSADEDET